jgi:hypothetical protein
LGVRRSRAAVAKISILLLLASALPGCNDEAADRARLEGKEAEIDRMIADRGCSGSGSCRFIAFGSKPCGGPWKYKIYSIEHVDTLALQSAVERYNAFNGELNQKYNWVSDCSVPAQPVVECVHGICQAVGP